MRKRIQDALCISDLRDMAKARLPKFLFEFVDRGAEDEVALRRNRSVFEGVKLRPRAMVDVSERTQTVQLFGKPHTLPIGIGPTGMAGMLWYQGELELARAAKSAGIPFTLSTASITGMEKVADQVGGTLWMQLYMWADRALSFELVRRTLAAGYEALMLTVDTAASANREYNRRNGFAMPFSYNRRNIIDVARHPKWLVDVMGRYARDGGIPTRENYPAGLQSKITQADVASRRTSAATLNWNDLQRLRDLWPKTLMVKGIMHPEDAARCAQYGVDGIVVSNHGGRMCDAAPSPIEVLPSIRSAVEDKITVIVDGGFRRGSDVVVALSLGADAVLVGRGPLYGTAVDGERGASRAISIYREEIDRTMAQLGCNCVSELAEIACT